MHRCHRRIGRDGKERETLTDSLNKQRRRSRPTGARAERDGCEQGFLGKQGRRHHWQALTE